MTRISFLTPLTSLAVAGFGGLAACSSDNAPAAPTVIAPVQPVPTMTAPADAPPTGTGATGSGVAPQPVAPPPGIIADDPDEPPVPIQMEPTICEAKTSQATVRLRPMDIVLVIDTSSSMDDEIRAVEENINQNLAQILDESGIDYRVILLSTYGPERGTVRDRFNYLKVCIEAPLGPEACEGRAMEALPHAPDRFFHAAANVYSRNAWCVMRNWARTGPEDDAVLADGWLNLLREGSFKSFLMISDDTIGCTHEEEGVATRTTYDGNLPEQAAKLFDEWLLTAAPEHFGTEEERSYTWHSIVGVQENPDPTIAYEASEPLVEDDCESAVNEGPPHQHLSLLTGGLRYPVCHVATYDAVFRRIAEGVVERAKLPCNWDVPQPPEGEKFDPGLLNLNYTPQGVGEPIALVNVDDAAQCGDFDAWYYDDPENPTQLFACPKTCELLEGDETGKIDLLLGCETLKPKFIK